MTLPMSPDEESTPTAVSKSCTHASTKEREWSTRNSECAPQAGDMTVSSAAASDVDGHSPANDVGGALAFMALMRLLRQILAWFSNCRGEGR
jgi:hypothetical protein